jgi:hypothetical protein
MRDRIHQMIQCPISCDVKACYAIAGSDDRLDPFSLELLRSGKALFARLDGFARIDRRTDIWIASINVAGTCANGPKKISSMAVDRAQTFVEAGSVGKGSKTLAMSVAEPHRHFSFSIKLRKSFEGLKGLNRG